MNIAVSNLAPSVTAHDLRQLFAPYGAVGMIHIAIDRHTGRSQGCGSVAMVDRHAAQAAIAGLHGTAYAGRVLTVHAAASWRRGRVLCSPGPPGSARVCFRI